MTDIAEKIFQQVHQGHVFSFEKGGRTIIYSKRINQIFVTPKTFIEYINSTDESLIADLNEIANAVAMSVENSPKRTIYIHSGSSSNIHLVHSLGKKEHLNYFLQYGPEFSKGDFEKELKVLSEVKTNISVTKYFHLREIDQEIISLMHTHQTDIMLLGTIKEYKTMLTNTSRARGVFTIQLDSVENISLKNLYKKDRGFLFSFPSDIDHEQVEQFLLSTVGEVVKGNVNIKCFQNIHRILTVLSKSISTLSIESTDDQSTINKTCEKCWAQHICWSSQSYQIFDFDIRNVASNVNRCNVIREFIAYCILLLTSIEHTKPASTTLHGFEIKAIN